MRMKTLAQVNAKADYTFHPLKTVHKRKATLKRIATCVALWAHVESLYGQILALAMHGDPRLAMDMYLAIGSAAQDAALKAATRSLPPKHREVFDAILILARPLATRRHELAHWLLGYSKAVPNALLLLDPKDGLRQLANNVGATRRKKVWETIGLSRGLIRVVSNAYLDNLAKEFEWYYFGLSMFVGLLLVQEGPKRGRREVAEEQYVRLYNEPRIREAIDHLHGLKNKTASPLSRIELKLGMKR